MSDKPEHNALVAFAALTALLAKHPELATVPVYWSYDRIGIHVTLPSRVTDLVVFEQVAAAFGASTSCSGPMKRDGIFIEAHYLNAELAGVPVHGSAHLVVEQGGGAR
ncbi:hypothetical protein OHV05_24680 [Kitasatospora sp. NBC_00070]|uniref:hypothetical protein n=1 Tax=Kitasatospora sp. NBC_00070 TaxID=2975962 RepID=UPI003250800B